MNKQGGSIPGPDGHKYVWIRASDSSIVGFVSTPNGLRISDVVRVLSPNPLYAAKVAFGKIWATVL